MKRETRTLYDVQGAYGQGWESLTCELSRREALDRLREYNREEGSYPHRIIVLTEYIDTPAD